LIGSGGNIAFANNAGKAAVWCMTTKTWIQVDLLLSEYGGMAASKGNFIVANKSGKAAAWSDLTKGWTQVSWRTAASPQPGTIRLEHGQP
jgi:hypothetical protein